MKQPKFISVNDRLPDLGSRVLCIEIWNDPPLYSLQIAIYRIDKVWGYPKNKPCFIDEQDEQPGVLNPQWWMPETDLLFLLPNIYN